MRETHYLKTWPTYFDEVVSNAKRFEIRKNDRDFKVGDYLVLQEYDPKEGNWTGQETLREISYILEGGQFGLEAGYVAMSLEHFDD